MHLPPILPARSSRAMLLALMLLAFAASAARGQEPSPAPPRAWLPLVHAPVPPPILLAAAHIDSAVSHEPDEALLLWNVGDAAQPLAGWTLVSGTRRATFPLTATLTLGPGERLWCAAQATAFAASFGEPAACEWAADTDPNAAIMRGDEGHADEDPAPHFAVLAAIAARNSLSVLSMGMSGDYLTAIEAGATHVRVGSALFGERNMVPATS